MYSLYLKLYISQLTENQHDAGLNVGFVYSLYSFFDFPFIYVYSDKNEPRTTLHFLCRPKSFADVMEHRHADFKPNYFSEKRRIHRATQETALQYPRRENGQRDGS